MNGQPGNADQYDFLDDIDGLTLNGMARPNFSNFCATWVEPEVRRLRAVQVIDGADGTNEEAPALTLAPAPALGSNVVELFA